MVVLLVFGGCADVGGVVVVGCAGVVVISYVCVCCHAFDMFHVRVVVVTIGVRIGGVGVVVCVDCVDVVVDVYAVYVVTCHLV